MELSTTAASRFLQDYSSYARSFYLYTDAQEWTLVLLPYFSAPLSVVGSGLILFVIWKERQTRLKESYHRLMLMLSLMNFLNSLSIVVLSNWSIPSVLNYPLASGNTTTCGIAGFFLNFVFGSMWYSFFLSLNFALRIKCERQPRCIARYCEPFAHILGCLYPIVAGSLATADGHMNPMEQLPGWCWSTDFPNSCSSEKSENVCLRGEDQSGTSDAATIIIIFIGIAICMVLITLKVRRTELNMRRYAGSTARAMTLTRQSRIQALWYMGTFGVVYFPIVGLMILGNDYTQHSQGLYFAFAFLTKLFTPLQGLFNACIYFRTNFQALTQDGRSLSFLPRWADRLSVTRLTRTNTTRDATASVAGSSDKAITARSNGRPAEACEKLCVCADKADNNGVNGGSASDAKDVSMSDNIYGDDCTASANGDVSDTAKSSGEQSDVCEQGSVDPSKTDRSIESEEDEENGGDSIT